MSEEKKIETLQAQFIDHINSTDKEIKELTEKIETLEKWSEEHLDKTHTGILSKKSEELVLKLEQKLESLEKNNLEAVRKWSEYSVNTKTHKIVLEHSKELGNIKSILKDKVAKAFDLIIKREFQISQNDNIWFANGIYTEKLAKLKNDIYRQLNMEVSKESVPKSEEAFCKTDKEFMGANSPTDLKEQEPKKDWNPRVDPNPTNYNPKALPVEIPVSEDESKLLPLCRYPLNCEHQTIRKGYPEYTGLMNIQDHMEIKDRVKKQQRQKDAEEFLADLQFIEGGALYDLQTVLNRITDRKEKCEDILK